MSAFVSYSLLLITSGAIYLGVPLSKECNCPKYSWIAISPKSAILTQSPFDLDFVNKILAGFKSRWIKGGFCLCKWLMPSRIWMNIWVAT